MGVWADEKRQGTDAILFTLPATDFEILLGKYLSVAAVYTDCAVVFDDSADCLVVDRRPGLGSDCGDLSGLLVGRIVTACRRYVCVVVDQQPNGRFRVGRASFVQFRY